jgi:hypothetical protein
LKEQQPVFRQTAVSRRVMKNLPPKLSHEQLRLIIENDTEMPAGITEEIFCSEIQNNSKIRWRVNHRLFRKDLLPLLIDSGAFKKWRLFSSINWLLVFSVVVFAVKVNDYRVLFFLIIYWFLRIPLDHWIFLLNVTLFFAVKFLFGINVPHLLFFTIVGLVTYLLNKATVEMVEGKILDQALVNWTFFWKYYSGRLIFMDQHRLNNEYARLTEKYPELIL